MGSIKQIGFVAKTVLALLCERMYQLVVVVRGGSTVYNRFNPFYINIIHFYSYLAASITMDAPPCTDKKS